jgi:hypothetical protein
MLISLLTEVSQFFIISYDTICLNVILQSNSPSTKWLFPKMYTHQNFVLIPCFPMSRNSSVGIATGYWLYDRMIGVRFPAPFDTTSRPGLETTQPPIQWVPGALSLGVKRPEHKADHSHPSSAEVTIPPLPQFVFMGLYLSMFLYPIQTPNPS